MAVVNSIKNLILTNYYERPFQPEIGSNVRRLLFENVDAILSASPYYNKPSQEGLFMHYKEIATHAPKPIILYNVPGRTGRNMNAATVLKLANEVENIIGIKEASGDMGQCMSILKDKPDTFFVVSGDDGLVLPQIACGMQGVISVAANAFPVEFGKMVQLCLANEFAAAKKINDSLLKAYDLMFEENNPYSYSCLKTKLHLAGSFSLILFWIITKFTSPKVLITF